MNINVIGSIIIANYNTNRKSYLPHTDKLPKIVVDYIWNELLKDEDEKVKSLFFIVRKSTELNFKKREGYSPIGWELLTKKGYSNSMKRLIELELLDYKEYVKPLGSCKGMSREYRIRLNLFYYLSSINPNRVKYYIEGGKTLWNGINNKPIRQSKDEIRHEIFKYNKNKKRDELIVSEIVAQGIIPIKYCVFNYLLVEEHLDFYREQWLIGNLSEKEALKYFNDENCYKSILERPFETLENDYRGLLVYKPKIKAQTSGRKSEVGGGFQSCSRDMKHEGFKYSPFTKNYDLKSSQIYGLKYQFMSARLNYGLIENYITVDKKVLAEKVGVNIDCWKGINYGAYFGGFPTRKLKSIKIVNNRKKDYCTLISLLSYEVVYKHICDFANIKTWYCPIKKRRECDIQYLGNQNITLKVIYEIIMRFYNHNKDLLEELLIWHDYLGTKFVEANSVFIKNEKYIINRSNMPLNISQFINKKGKVSSEGKRKLAAHLLQGQEALFISRITWYSEKFKDCPYNVISDQHDGLIVNGFIPEEYVEMARQETGFTFAYLVEKPYK